jgi:diguanylate cyclase (GGDEF)-like protein/PAS domain S-box-containing protein
MNTDFEQLIGLLRDVVIVTEAESTPGDGPRIVYVNPAFTRLTGYAADEAVGRSVCMLRGPATDAGALARLRAAVTRGETAHEVVLNYTKSGDTCWMDLSVKPLRDADGRITHYAAIERDVSAHKAIERRMQLASGFDPLTGLVARREFFERAEQARGQSRAGPDGFGLVLLDIDYFRSLNATHGIETGDELLVQVATAIRGAVRPIDIAGRVAGDEFLIAMPKVDVDQAIGIAQHLRAAIRRIRLPGLPWLSITASFGVACIEHGQDSLTTLLARAEKACEESRRAGRNRVMVDRAFGKVIPFRPRIKAEPAMQRMESPLLAE